MATAVATAEFLMNVRRERLVLSIVCLTFTLLLCTPVFNPSPRHPIMSRRIVLRNRRSWRICFVAGQRNQPAVWP